MSDAKSILESKAIWGALISVAGVLGGRFGFEIVDSAGWAADLVALFGAGLAMYGRVKAVKRIGVK